MVDDELPEDVRQMLVLFSSHLHVHLDETTAYPLAVERLAFQGMLEHLHPILDRYGLPHRLPLPAYDTAGGQDG